MSKIWPNFSKEQPCPACNHFDWTCRAGDKKFVCMRVQSNHAAKDGGWYHDYGDKKPAYIPPKRTVPKVNLDFEKYWNNLIIRNPWSGDLMAEDLGVSYNSLVNLGMVKDEIEKAWAIPMRDGENKIIGIHLRCDDGSKKAVLGSRNGLFIPQVEPQKFAYLPEGMSNTAALLTMGYYAIGRPSCNSGAEMLKVALKRLQISRIVIVADNDEVKANGQRPGQDGAKKLKKDLGLMSVVFTPPSPLKDVRELLQKLGIESARNYINSSIQNKVWTRC